MRASDLRSGFALQTLGQEAGLLGGEVTIEEQQRLNGGYGNVALGGAGGRIGAHREDRV